MEREKKKPPINSWVWVVCIYALYVHYSWLRMNQWQTIIKTLCVSSEHSIKLKHADNDFHWHLWEMRENKITALPLRGSCSSYKFIWMPTREHIFTIMTVLIKIVMFGPESLGEARIAPHVPIAITEYHEDERPQAIIAFYSIDFIEFFANILRHWSSSMQLTSSCRSYQKGKEYSSSMCR